jgi:hypothetical protein
VRANPANYSYYIGSGGYGTLERNLDDDNRMDEDDVAPHRSTMTTAPEANTIAIALLPIPLTDDTAILPIKKTSLSNSRDSKSSKVLHRHFWKTGSSSGLLSFL